MKNNPATFDEEVLPKKKSIKKVSLALLKLLLTITLLYAVFVQIEAERMLEYIKKSNVIYLLVALVALNLGQVASGLRMRYYYAVEGLHLSRSFSIALYYVGMLFNLVLPGGIGGDGYKAYYIKKHRHFSLKRSIILTISQRGSGLLLLCIFTILLSFFSPSINSIPNSYLLISLALIAVFPCYSFFAKTFLKEELSTQIGAMKYSVFVQGSVVISAIALLYSVGYSGNMIDYLVLFMISSIMSILPISIGGVGLREMTFFLGAGIMNLDQELGVTISVLYFFINALASLMGVLFFYNLGEKDGSTYNTKS